jgi:hypothetical protein
MIATALTGGCGAKDAGPQGGNPDPDEHANARPSSGGSCYACETGRPPRGFSARPARAPSLAAERLAQMAQLEAASVDAFVALYADLEALAAPRSLLAGVRTAALDEVRHAYMTTRAAERLGACVPRVEIAPIPRRSLEQLAIENAQEGCVRETFGAALAAMQAERAGDVNVRRMMRVIARDELEHAALAWRIAAWLEEQLDAEASARVRMAREAALGALEEEVARDVPADDALGLPPSGELRGVFARIREALATGQLAA